MPSLCLPCALCPRAINQITDTSWTICSSECLFEFFNQHVIRRIFFMSRLHARTANIPRVDREGLYVFAHVTPIFLPGLYQVRVAQEARVGIKNTPLKHALILCNTNVQLDTEVALKLERIKVQQNIYIISLCLHSALLRTAAHILNAGGVIYSMFKKLDFI